MRKLPTQKIIYRFWEERFLKAGLNIEEKACFACGKGTNLDRAHIKPKINGGSDLVNNLHLLCPGCHNDSEFIWGGSYWRWIIYINKNEYKNSIMWAMDRMKKIGFSTKTLNRLGKQKSKEKLLDYIYKKLEGGLSDKKYIIKFNLNKIR